MRRSMFELAASGCGALVLAACAVEPAEPAEPALPEAAQRVASYVRSKNVDCLREAIAVVHERPWEWSCLWDDMMDAVRGQPPGLQYDLLTCCACVEAWACWSEPSARLGTRSHDDIYFLVDIGSVRGELAWKRALVLREIETGSISPESILDGTWIVGTSASVALEVAVEYIDRHGMHKLSETRCALRRALQRGEALRRGDLREHCWGGGLGSDRALYGEEEEGVARALKRMLRLLGE